MKFSITKLIFGLFVTLAVGGVFGGLAHASGPVAGIYCQPSGGESHFDPILNGPYATSGCGNSPGPGLTLDAANPPSPGWDIPIGNTSSDPLRATTVIPGETLGFQTSYAASHAGRYITWVTIDIRDETYWDGSLKDTGNGNPPAVISKCRDYRAPSDESPFQDPNNHNFKVFSCLSEGESIQWTHNDSGNTYKFQFRVHNALDKADQTFCVRSHISLDTIENVRAISPRACYTVVQKVVSGAIYKTDGTRINVADITSGKVDVNQNCSGKGSDAQDLDGKPIDQAYYDASANRFKFYTHLGSPFCLHPPTNITVTDPVTKKPSYYQLVGPSGYDFQVAGVDCGNPDFSNNIYDNCSPLDLGDHPTDGTYDFTYKPIVCTPPDPRCTPVSAGVSQKIFGMNVIQAGKQYVRDNESVPFNLLTYLWPNAGYRVQNAGDGVHYWLAGLWGRTAGDNSTNELAANVDPNKISVIINNLDDLACNSPQYGSLCRVPLAYVPQAAPYTATGVNGGDGNTTPHGNNFLSIVNGVIASADQAAIHSFTDRLGGLWSNRHDNVGGAVGSYVHNEEISNIRVEAAGIHGDTRKASVQGPVADSLLQYGSRTAEGANQPIPYSGQGPTTGPAWDNIRNPGVGPFSDPQTANLLDFDNNRNGYPGSPANFGDVITADPHSLFYTFYGRAQQYSNVTATSLLQDGKGGGYHAASEPLSYTAGLKSADQIHIKWDEYTNWTQADDKGHYYTSRGILPTGVDRGAASGNFNVPVNYISGVNPGSPQVTGYLWHCGTANPPQDWWGWGGPSAPFGAPWFCGIADVAYTTPVTSCIGATEVTMTAARPTFYSHQVESQYGWLNTNSTPTGFIPYGGNGGFALSYFANQSPAWANTGSASFWQDTNVTPMDNSGASFKFTHDNRWIMDRTDPRYTNRWVYDVSHTWGENTGWAYTGQQCATYYPNGGYSVAQRPAFVGTYYPSWHYLFENSGGAVSAVPGSDFGSTGDGSLDGVVDTGWSWWQNIQRVQYEQTFKGRYRNLGPYSADGSVGRIINGIEGLTSLMKYARGSAIIGNPTIGGADGDIYSANNVSSYFDTSGLDSAFIFSRGSTIERFSTSGTFPNYLINPDRDRVNNTFGTAAYVFKNFSDMDGGATTIGATMSGSVNLGGNTYKTGGDLTINGAQFCGGTGTIIVHGNLTINGNTSYCPGAGSARSSISSVGFIVLGNIRVAPSVSSIVGSYFTQGSFSTGTNVTQSNRTTSDAPFNLQGLVIANNFNLQRQLGGQDNINGLRSESFQYDGRVVVAPPPGFSALYSASAAWNETVPSN